MRLLEFPRGFQYIGADIVDEIVMECNSKYGSDTKNFINLDLTTDPHPRTDLWFCRDGLIHLSKRDIIGAFSRFVESNTKYCLISQYNNVHDNIDIATGLTRPVNLLLPPFRLPPPRRRVQDRPLGEEARELGLWAREDVANALASMPDHDPGASGKPSTSPE